MQRRFQLRRTIRQQNEVGLLRKTHQLGSARLVCRPSRWRERRKKIPAKHAARGRVSASRGQQSREATPVQKTCLSHTGSTPLLRWDLHFAIPGAKYYTPKPPNRRALSHREAIEVIGKAHRAGKSFLDFRYHLQAPALDH